MAEKSGVNWGAIITGAALVTGIAAAALFVTPGITAKAAGEAVTKGLTTAAEFIGKAVAEAGSWIADFAAKGVAQKAAILGTAAVAGGFAAKVVAGGSESEGPQR